MPKCILISNPSLSKTSVYLPYLRFKSFVTNDFDHELDIKWQKPILQLY